MAKLSCMLSCLLAAASALQPPAAPLRALRAAPAAAPQLRISASSRWALYAGGDDYDEDGNYVPPKQEYDTEGIGMPDFQNPVTLTAIGFGLIAFNFFVLAGFGSGGL